MTFDTGLIDQKMTTLNEAQTPPWMQGENAEPGPKKIGNPNWYRGMPSPHPAGRPKGSTAQTKLVKRMLDGAEDVIEAVMGKAREGDSAAASLVLARIIPALRSQTLAVTFDFDASAPATRQVEQVLEGIASGAVPADIGKQIIDAIGALSAVRATEELEARLAALEAKEEHA